MIMSVLLLLIIVNMRDISYFAIRVKRFRNKTGRSSQLKLINGESLCESRTSRRTRNDLYFFLRRDQIFTFYFFSHYLAWKTVLPSVILCAERFLCQNEEDIFESTTASSTLLLFTIVAK